jgi:hypothetical protein
MRYPSDPRVYLVYFTQPTPVRILTPVNRQLCCAWGICTVFWGAVHASVDKFPDNRYSFL